ncbi:MAG TPA: CRISPR-associated endonuclease Cas2 [Myxococcales bacterium]|nr:CRISPR-associated endonuclease Cas2 [Deltaproteobacteria bacterium]MBU50990.1 CRISPR-associated endonuclease Cas2 [Deltaproteobacteria bacterium]HAA53764.1 CRISPR-associated endonuclease Cas2 [Myxococcales bacterium]
MFFVISYDVSDDKRRTQIHKALKSFGLWVQYSLFECELSKSDYVRLRERLEALSKPEEDNLRFYKLCQVCQETVERIGEDPRLDEFGIFIE